MHHVVRTLVVVAAVSACRVSAPASAERAPAPAPDPARALPVTSVAVLSIVAKGGADPRVSEVLDDVLLSSLQSSAGSELRIVGKTDIDAVLGLERAKDALGCQETSCAVEIAGALGVESIIAPSIGKLGDKNILTLAWIRQQDARVLGRHTETLGAAADQFDAGVARAVAALLGRPVAAARLDISGVWDTEWESRGGLERTQIRFLQEGTNVTGTYAQGGTYRGTLAGNVLEGVWENNGTGSFRFEFSADARSFTGTWGFGADARQFRQTGRR
jgi:hypothetical protein